MDQIRDIFRELMDDNVTAIMLNGSSKKLREMASDNIKLAKQGLELVEQIQLDEAIEEASK